MPLKSSGRSEGGFSFGSFTEREIEVLWGKMVTSGDTDSEMAVDPEPRDRSLSSPRLS